MIPVPFAEQNYVFEPAPDAPPNEMPTPCFVGEDAIAVCFEVSDEEIAELQNTNRLWVYFSGRTMPKVFITTENRIQHDDAYDFPEEIDDETD